MNGISRFSLIAITLLLIPALVVAQEATPDPEATPESNVMTLPEGVERVAAELPLLGVYEYAILLEAGDVLTVVANDPTGAADPVLTLVDPSGTIVAENDNHDAENTTLNDYSAVIENLAAEESGEYLIHVDNNFFEVGVVDLYIVTGEAVTLDELFTEGDDAILPTPQVQLQERPQVRTTGPCTASVDFIAARLRAAPTASSPQVASLVPGVPLVINGKVRGADNYIWYRLENYLWVRSDAVLAAGACGNVPTF